MAEFTMEIAGCAGRVVPMFESTRAYFLKYLTDREADFSFTVKPENLVFEQRALDEEADAEGMKRRLFTDPFLERTAIQRAFAEHLLTRGTLLLHGSAVAVDGRGYLFTAKCGTGKSTHTRFWCQVFGSRAVMVNDDKPFVRLDREKTVLCGSPWSGKHGLDANISVPLAGICILQRGQENRIRSISAAEASEMLLHQAQPPVDPEGYPAFAALVEELLGRVPLWKMECTKDSCAAHIAHQAMADQKV